MKWLYFLVLVATGWFLMDSGLMFVGFLAFLAAVMLLLTGTPEPSSPPHSAPPGSGPLYVESTGDTIPKTMHIKIKKGWKDDAPFEYAIYHWGQAVDNIGRSIAWLFNGGKK